MDFEARYQSVLKLTEEEYPDFRIRSKSSSMLMRFIHYFLLVVSFGQNRKFMTGYTTVIGRTMYVTDRWDSSSAHQRHTTLVHERIHFAQQDRYTKLGFSLLYLFAFLPFGVAYYRRKFEQEAYEASMRTRAFYFGVGSLKFPAYREAMIQHFTSFEYGWMWPWRKSIEGWYDRVVAEVERDQVEGAQHVEPS